MNGFLDEYAVGAAETGVVPGDSLSVTDDIAICNSSTVETKKKHMWVMNQTIVVSAE